MSFIVDGYRICCSDRHTREATYSLALDADQNPQASTATSLRADPRQPYQVQNTHPADREYYYHGVPNLESVSYYRQFGIWIRERSTRNEYTAATADALANGRVYETDENGIALTGRVDILDNPSLGEQVLPSSMLNERISSVSVPPRTRIVTETVEFPNRGCLSCIQRVFSRCWSRVWCAMDAEEL